MATTDGLAVQADIGPLNVQGEYTGEMHRGKKIGQVAVQVIAVGNDRFAMVLYTGGLPGDGWQPSTGRTEFVPQAQADGKVVFEDEGRKFVVEKQTITVLGEKGRVEGELKRVHREGETLGKTAPDNAMVLFDGSSGENFQAQDGGDPVVDGVLRQGIVSKGLFGGVFELHIEFKLPFEPEKSGQGRGNSGVYLQGRYEVQMLDSFGLAGEHNECGGIYSISKPDVNMCYPPETWQTFDIEFTAAKWDGDTKTANARMTVRHNGVLIHDDVELPKTTTAAPLKESSDSGYVFLQNHGSPVRFRNIWVLQK